MNDERAFVFDKTNTINANEGSQMDPAIFQDPGRVESW